MSGVRSREAVQPCRREDAASVLSSANPPYDNLKQENTDDRYKAPTSDVRQLPADLYRSPAANGVRGAVDRPPGSEEQHRGAGQSRQGVRHPHHHYNGGNRELLGPHLSRTACRLPRAFFAGDRKSTRLNSSHYCASRMPSSA